MRSTNFQPNALNCSEPLGSQKRFLPFLLTETLVCMPLPLTPTTGGQEACGHLHLGGNLAADELVQLDLIGCGHDVAVVVVDLELRRRDLGMILLVLKAHRALDLGDGIDEIAQRIARKRVIVAAGIDVFELAGFVVAPLRVETLEEKALDLVGGVERVAFLGIVIVRELLERAANVAAEGFALAVQNVGEDEHLAGAEDIGRSPVEGAPIQREPQIALALWSKTADGGSVESEVVVGPQQEFLVVVEHVQPAFEVAEEHGQRLDSRLLGKIAKPLLFQDRKSTRLNS